MSDAPKSIYPETAERKLVYVKRWRTIVDLPAKYADEIVEALRAPAQRSPRLRKAEADGGFNIIIDDTWAAFFPKASETQIDFLIDRVSASLGHRCDDGSKAFPVSSETSVPASPPDGSGAENPTASSVSSTHEPVQTAQVPATQENIFDCLYANVYADNDGVAGISAFIEDLMERFDVRLKASAVPSTDREGK